ncbi:MAG: hypothetical protein A2Y53_05740 [Chloroflexi bacterium RBG_16_47_49]|nr:MAG: hypothetical protein A2Y53_05740 [Chloroflexi bacterium RBG_16_47_49]
MSVASGTDSGFVQLWNATGAAAIHTMNLSLTTTDTRYRSANLKDSMPTSASDCYVIVKAKSTSVNLKGCQLIIYQNGEIKSTRIYWPIGGQDSTGSTSYIEFGSTPLRYLHDKSKFNGVIACYYEVTIRRLSTTATSRAALYSLGGTRIDSVNTTSATAVRLRSGDVWASLTADSVYTSRYRTSNALRKCAIYGAFLVFDISSNPTRVQIPYPLFWKPLITTSSTFSTDAGRFHYFEPNKIATLTPNWFYEMTGKMTVSSGTDTLFSMAQQIGGSKFDSDSAMIEAAAPTTSRMRTDELTDTLATADKVGAYVRNSDNTDAAILYGSYLLGRFGTLDIALDPSIDISQQAWCEYVIQDAKLLEDSSAVNYGYDTLMGAGTDAAGGNIYHSVLTFPLPYCNRAPLQLDSAILYLWGLTELSTTDEYIYIYRTDKDWVENRASYESTGTGETWLHFQNPKLDSFLFDAPNKLYRMKLSTVLVDTLIDVATRGEMQVNLALINADEISTNTRKYFATQDGYYEAHLYLFGACGEWVDQVGSKTKTILWTLPAYITDSAATTNLNNTNLSIGVTQGSPPPDTFRIITDLNLKNNIPHGAVVEGGYLGMYWTSSPGTTNASFWLYQLTKGTVFDEATATWVNKATSTPWTARGGDFTNYTSNPLANFNTGSSTVNDTLFSSTFTVNARTGQYALTKVINNLRGDWWLIKQNTEAGHNVRNYKKVFYSESGSIPPHTIITYATSYTKRLRGGKWVHSATGPTPYFTEFNRPKY